MAIKITQLHLTSEEQVMLDGKMGNSVRKAMEIIVALAKIYNAPKLISINSVQVSGVSFDNLGEAGLQFLESLAKDGAKCQVPTTLNPAGMDLQNWKMLGIDSDFAAQQLRVIDAYQNLGVENTCTCTPYLIGYVPHFREHIAWSESSAVAYANSFLGAYTNREGGPSALASALTGRTAYYGFHLDEYRVPEIGINLEFDLPTTEFRTHLFGALAKLIGEKITLAGEKPIPLIRGLKDMSIEEMKSFSASIATYGGLALFHIADITPEANHYPTPDRWIEISKSEFQQELDKLGDFSAGEINFISLGCPHLSFAEIRRIAELVEGKQVRIEFWLTTARKTKEMADQLGYTSIIEKAGIKFATDTCCVVAPIKNRFQGMLTDSAKAYFYGKSKNNFDPALLSLEQIIQFATQTRN